MPKLFKADQPVLGCEFCNDPDFALRHTLEDQLLNKIAQVAFEITQQVTHMVPAERMIELRALLKDFAELDSIDAQQKRAVKALRAIEDDLS